MVRCPCLPRLLRCLAVRSGLPLGIATAANCSFPCTFWNVTRGIRLAVVLRIRLVSVQMVLALLAGRSIVRAMPSKSQPRISFLVSHVPSATSFLTETGGPMVLLVISGGEKTLVMALRMARESRRSWVLSVHWMRPCLLYTSPSPRD